MTTPTRRLLMALVLGCLGFLSSAQSQTIANQKVATGTVSGRVTLRGKGVPGIGVALRRSESDQRRPALIGTTDPEGNYRISRVPAGQYQAAPVAPTFVIPEMTRSGHEGKLVLLTESENVVGIDFTLVRAGVITGKVLDAEGRPVVEERLNLIGVDSNNQSMRSQMLDFRTDDRGVYRIFGLPAGRYKVVVGEDGRLGALGSGRPRRPYRLTFHPDAADSSEAAIVEVLEGGETVTGIELATKPLGAISGRVALEESKVPECKGKRRPLFGETLVTPWHNENNAAKDKPQFLWSLGTPTIPDKQGDFILRNLAPGQYRFNTRSFAKYWYLQSISLPSSIAPGVRTTPANRPTDAARNWTTMKSGERVSGLTITLAEGAASLHGQIKTAENRKLPARLFLYLVPAEREKAEDVLRFFASLVSTDGRFALNNLPPGRYWAIAKPAGENESNVLSKLRLPDEAEARAKLGQEAEVAKTEIELKPCENVTNYSLPFVVP